MIRYYLAEDPILASVPTRLCRRPEDLEYTLDNLERLIVKRVGESGGYGMLVGPHATPAERHEYAKTVRANPADFISQPVLSLSRAPCLIDGRAEPRHVDLRPFILRGRETRIVPGAFCRVALRKGSLVVNSSQGGGGKDVWVLDEAPAPDRSAHARNPLRLAAHLRRARTRAARRERQPRRERRRLDARRGVLHRAGARHRHARRRCRDDDVPRPGVALPGTGPLCTRRGSSTFW